MLNKQICRLAKNEKTTDIQVLFRFKFKFKMLYRIVDE